MIKNTDLTPLLGSIRIPTLFLAAEFDYAIPSTVASFQRLVSKAKFAVIPQSGHLMMQDRPELHNRIVGTFISENDQLSNAISDTPQKYEHPAYGCGDGQINRAGDCGYP